MYWSRSRLRITKKKEKNTSGVYSVSKFVVEIPADDTDSLAFKG